MGEALGITKAGIIGAFRATYEGALGGTWWPRLGMKFDSNNDSETYKWLGMSPAMRLWVDGRSPARLKGEGITIVNDYYESSIAIFKEERRRDQSGQIDLRIQEMARKAAEHPGRLFTDAIIAGKTTVCYEGQFFFDDDHQEGDSGVQTNLLDSGDVAALNVTDPNNPTPDEMEKAILGVIQHFYKILDDKGDEFNGGADRFLVMVPVVGTYWSSARQAISASFLDTGAGVRDNTLRQFNIDVVPNVRLGTVGSWATEMVVFRTDAPAKPFILQEEYPLTEDFVGEGSEETFLNRNLLFGVEWAGGVGYGYWQYAMHATFS